MKHLIALLTFLSSIINIIYAQTGPGGVGSSSNNVIWLNGDDITLSSSPNISSWNDQSGNNNDFTQGVASSQPYKVNYNTGNPFTAIRFRSDFLTNSGIAALNTNTISQFFVFEGAQANHSGIVLDCGFTESNQFLRTDRSNGNLRSLVLNSSLQPKVNSTAISSSFQIVSSIWDGAGAQTFETFKNGASIGSKTGANGNPTGNFKNSIGATINGNSKFLQDDIAEIIVYTDVLNSAERNIVENYLAARYGISISNDMYAYETTHGYEVIGIGQEADGNNLTAQGKGIVEITIASMANGEYIFTGHDNTDLSLTNNDVPTSLSGGSRLARVWRADVTGTPGNVDVVYDITGLPISGPYYLLVESVNGIFNDGGVVQYGPVAAVGNLVTFNNVSIAAGDYYSLATGNGVAIASIKTGDWDQTSTWNCACIPGSGDDVTITNGHTVTVDAAAAVNSITIDGTLNTQAVTSFDVYGNYTVNATGSAIHKAINFIGSSTQSITNNSASTIDFGTLVIDNSNDVTLDGGAFEISTSLTISNGSLINNSSKFTFLSTATRTAVLLNSTGTGISGNYIIQRYISSRNANWGDFSSPVTSTTLGDWDATPDKSATELYMSHVGGVDGDAGNFFSVWDWNESTQKYDSIIDTSYVLPVGKAIEIWLGDNDSTFNAKTIDTRGTPNFGTIPVAVVNSWNLVGNPYPAWIDWSLLTKPTLNSTYYIWNTNNGSYDAKTAGKIPPHQGFWVESVGNGTLTFEEADKTSSASSTFWREINTNLIVEENYAYYEGKIVITNPENNYNTTAAFRLSDISSSNEDYFDGSYRKGRIIETPEVYSHALNSNRNLSINSFTNDADELTFPVVLKVAEANNYKLSFTGFKDFSTFYNNVLFVDKINNKVYNVANDREIEIYLDPMNFNDEQFELRFNNNLNSISANHNINIYKTEDFTIIETDESNLNITVYNAIGQEILNNIKTNGKITYIPNNKIPKGVNIISVQANDETITKKLMY